MVPVCSARGAIATIERPVVGIGVTVIGVAGTGIEAFSRLDR